MAEATATNDTVTLAMTAQEAQLLLLAAAKYALPQRGNLATQIVLNAVVNNAGVLAPEYRAILSQDLSQQAYVTGDPWVDLDSAVYREAAELIAVA